MQWIFVGGCPRSGTTLLGTLLGSLPHHMVVPESQFKKFLLDKTRRLSRAELIAELASSLPFRLWGLGDNFIRTIPADYEPDDVLNAMAISVGNQRGQQPNWVVDHTPSNLRATVSAQLALAMPNALFVHVVRDPRGVVNSIRRCDWGPASIRASTEWWREWLSSASQAQSRLGARCIRVQFEDLVQHPEATVRRIVSQSLSVTQPLEAPILSPDAIQLVDPRRSDAWRTELPRFAQAEILRLTQRERQTIGNPDVQVHPRNLVDSMRLLLDESMGVYRVGVLQPRRYARRRKMVVSGLDSSK